MTNSNDLPLSEAVFFILLSLSPGPKHGYAIMKDVQQLSNDRVRLSTGTLYGALKRMLNQKWVERVKDAQPVETGRQRKEYILTQSGMRILGAEAARMRSLAAMVHLRRAEN